MRSSKDSWSKGPSYNGMRLDKAPPTGKSSPAQTPTHFPICVICEICGFNVLKSHLKELRNLLSHIHESPPGIAAYTWPLLPRRRHEYAERFRLNSASAGQTL